MLETLFMGIDIGTQGIRAIVMNADGKLVNETSMDFDTSVKSVNLPEGWVEQSPAVWWETIKDVIVKSLNSLKIAHHTTEEICALCVTSTSGTIIPLNNKFEPIHDAIMYNDNRTLEEAEDINSVSEQHRQRFSYRFTSSFGLPKILWIKRREPSLYKDTRIFLHASDFIAGKISETYNVSDYSNALKTGYDVESFKWPDFIQKELGIPHKRLPKVFRPGTPIGHVSDRCAKDTGLSKTTTVVVGMTDGCSSQISSGAVKVGQWNTTIGTTMIIKGVTNQLLFDPTGVVYSHRHPDGYWMPGGASNIGGDCLEVNFRREEYNKLNRAVSTDKPTNLIIYPLQKKHARFPIFIKNASGFICGIPKSTEELYQGYLEGVGYVEKLAYEILQKLGAVIGDTIYVSGGATRSAEWLQIRANILNRVICKPKVVGAHVGAAVLAASRTYYHSLVDASRNMTSRDVKIYPNTQAAKLYENKYFEFVEIMAEKGYLERK